MKEIDFDKIEPFDLMQRLKLEKDTEMINRIIKAKVFKIRDWELIIPSFPCIITKWDKPRKNHFPFMHQVFWFNLMELKDVKFAISEVEMIVKWVWQYMFPNGTVVQLVK